MDKFITVDSTNHAVIDNLGGVLISINKATVGNSNINVLGFGEGLANKFTMVAASAYNSNYIVSTWFRFCVSSHVFMVMFGNDMNFTKYRIVAISDITTGTGDEFIGYECMHTGSSSQGTSSEYHRFVNDHATIINTTADVTARSALNNGVSDYYVLMPIFVGNKCARNFYTIDCGTNSVSLLTPFIISNTTYISPYAKVAIKID
jgi:hypothetical protein